MHCIYRHIMYCVLFGPAVEEISIIKFHEVENSDRAINNNISFAFEVDPPIQYGDPLMYDIELWWEEGVTGRSGRRLGSNHYPPLQSSYYMPCKELGNFSSNGQTYQFSVSKQGLGSGPLYVNVSVSLLSVCNDSSYEYDRDHRCSRCPHWRFSGQSNTIRIPTIHGMYDMCSYLL